MMNREQEDRLARVGPGTPMARLFREYWIPAARSAALQADGAPQRVRLFGENYVVFRATDGTLGFLDEACPHRGTSLALARNEGDSLHCIYHGWRFEPSGRLLDAPCEAANPRRQAFIDSVRAGSYLARGGSNDRDVGLATQNLAPEMEIDDTPYGMREAALRDMPDGSC